MATLVTLMMPRTRNRKTREMATGQDSVKTRRKRTWNLCKYKRQKFKSKRLTIGVQDLGKGKLRLQSKK